MMYLCIASFIPAALSAILTVMFTFVLAILNIILIVVDLLLMLITLKYIRKDIVAHSARAGRMTARTGFFFQIFPIIAYLIIFAISPVELGIVFSTLDYTLFIFWGISCILNVIGAILYKLPKKKQTGY